MRTLLRYLLPVTFLVSNVVASAMANELPDPQRPHEDYAVVASNEILASVTWKPVVEALLEKHQGTLVTYEKDPNLALPALKEIFPRYTCFVAQPLQADRAFVATVHKMTRDYDEDPYSDTLWGILTGFDAQNALSIAGHSKPLVIRKVASGTEFATEMVEQGVWYCELNKGKKVVKEARSTAVEVQGPDDTTKELVETLTKYQADLFITSGHATERDWQIGFRYRNGYFRCQNGQLFGINTQKQKFRIDSPNPKVYMPIGNCLMGHIDSQDAMALAWMKSAGVHQMIGYTVPTWFGYAGWGCLDYFVEQPGRYSFVEAFHANQHALNYCLQQNIGSRRGLQFDQNVVALYGDPKWVANMKELPKAYDQTLVIEDGIYTLRIEGNRGEKSFSPVNTNGSQRGFRPIIQFLPHRVDNIQIMSGQELEPLITDDFILIPNPREYDSSKSYEVKFKAEGI